LILDFGGVPAMGAYLEFSQTVPMSAIPKMYEGQERVSDRGWPKSVLTDHCVLVDIGGGQTEVSC
jgi:hypothetical protein